MRRVVDGRHPAGAASGGLRYANPPYDKDEGDADVSVGRISASVMRRKKPKFTQDPVLTPLYVNARQMQWHIGL